MTYTEKMVNYFKYCDKCKYKDLTEIEEPCNECLSTLINEDSVIPIKYEEK